MNKIKFNKNFIIGTAVGGIALLSTAFSIGVVNAQSLSNTNFLSRVAQLVGVDQTKLTNAFKTAKTEQIDQQLKDGKITQAQADKMKSEIASGKWNPDFGMGEGKHMAGPGKTFDYLAKFLGITDTDLKVSLDKGTKLSDIITGKGKTTADAKAYILQQLKTDLDTQVKSGKITQTEEDNAISRESKMFDNMLNNTMPKGRNHNPNNIPTNN